MKSLMNMSKLCSLWAISIITPLLMQGTQSLLWVPMKEGMVFKRLLGTEAQKWAFCAKHPLIVLML